MVDTHVVVWLAHDDARLGSAARGVIDSSVEDGILVSAISVLEIARLAHHGHLALGQEIGAWLEAILEAPGVRLAPLEPAIAIDSVALPGQFHRDPADRIIIATARARACPVLTGDRAILRYASQGHVRALDAGR